MNNLDRFIEAQKKSYSIALNEIKNGKKVSHWMWYIFPQVIGLGYSEMANYYGIEDIDEAKAYLSNEVLGPRLREITSEVLKVNKDNPEDIFGYVDAMKLRSSMTLFDYVSSEDIFKDVLDKYYGGKIDEKTIAIIESKKKFKSKKMKNLL